MLLVISVCSSDPCLHSHQPTPSSGPAWVTGSCPTGPWTLTASWQFRTSSPKTRASMFARAQICLPWTRATPSSTCQVRDPRHRIPLPITPCYPTSSGSCSRPVPSPSPTPTPLPACSGACFPVLLHLSSCTVNTQLLVNSIIGLQI